MSRATVLAGTMAQVAAIVASTRGIALEPLRDGLEQSDIGDTLAPLLYPSEWLDRGKREESLRQLVRAVLDFRQRLDEILA